VHEFLAAGLELSFEGVLDVCQAPGFVESGLTGFLE
jgi:hypothetical protein